LAGYKGEVLVISRIKFRYLQAGWLAGRQASWQAKSSIGRQREIEGVCVKAKISRERDRLRKREENERKGERVIGRGKGRYIYRE
jgi:hypothetical protein